MNFFTRVVTPIVDKAEAFNTSTTAMIEVFHYFVCLYLKSNMAFVFLKYHQFKKKKGLIKTLHRVISLNWKKCNIVTIIDWKFI